MRRRHRVTALFGLVFVLAAAELCAQRPSAAIANPLLLELPGDAGHIVAIHQPSPAAPATGASLKTIIHIQDAHANYGAQKHLATLVDILARRYAIELVLVEGGEGNASVSYLRTWAPLEKRRAIAEEFLKAGKMSGEEYLDIIADYPLQLWGVDSEELYDENLQAFLDSEPLRERMGLLVEELAGALQDVTARVYPPALRALTAAAEQYAADQLSFAEYLGRVREWSATAGLSLDVYPALSAYLRARALESQLRMDRVQAEQTQALNLLQQRARPERFAQIIELGQEMQAGARPPLDFYQAVDQLLAAHGLSAAYPHLRAYLEHTRLTAALQTATLSNELERCTQQLRSVLAGDPAIAKLVPVDDGLTILRRLFALELTPTEYLAFGAQWERSNLADRWLPVLREFGVESPALAQLSGIQAAIPEVAQFYALARQRNYRMVDNTLKKLEETGAPAAILIAGGFHTPTLTKLLTDRGVQVIVVAPIVDEVTDEALYHHILKTQRKLPPEERARRQGPRMAKEQTKEASHD